MLNIRDGIHGGCSATLIDMYVSEDVSIFINPDVVKGALHLRFMR
jgi:hypothetical protein